MKFMMIVKATEQSEAGVMPGEELFLEMNRYNEQLQEAGILRDLIGLHPTSNGARVVFTGNERKLIDGPFAEAKELIAGYWVIEVGSKQEALDWAMKVPHPSPGVDTNVEIRQIFGLEDFPNLPDEVYELESKIQAGRS
jgi:hypothetical protein